MLSTDIRHPTSDICSYAFGKDSRHGHAHAGSADVRGGVGADGERCVERGGDGGDAVWWADVRARPRHTAPGWREVVQAWRFVETAAAGYGVGPRALLAVLAGLWWGAASHTLADVAWSIIRKGSEIF
jgi:hypothetical protein